MSVLPDHEIELLCRDGVLHPLIAPFNEQLVQPASYDLRLGTEFVLYADHMQTHLDTATLDDKGSMMVGADTKQGFILAPLKFVLGTTIETVWLPDDITARVEPKSSLERPGLLLQGGAVDPGYHGRLTLGFFNARGIPIVLRPGVPIAQIIFSRMNEPAAQSYDGLYQDSRGVQASRHAR